MNKMSSNTILIRARSSRRVCDLARKILGVVEQASLSLLLEAFNQLIMKRHFKAQPVIEYFI